MDNDNSKQVCTNCKYFQRYYVIGGDCRFKATDSGYCTNSKVDKQISSKRINKNENCDLWQPYELKKLKIQYGVEQYLQYYGKIIEDMLAVFRDVE